MSGDERSLRRAHEERAGDLVVEKQLLAADHVVLADWRLRLAAEPPARLGSALMLLVRMLSRDDRGWRLREPVLALLRKRFEVTDADAVLAARTATGALFAHDGFVAVRIAEVMLRRRFGPTVVDEAGAAVVRQLVDFAAHVLRYGQAYALFKERGWTANYLGPYDGGYEGSARREFRAAGITAVFEHFPVDQDMTGPPQLCTTDRVWFHRGDRARAPIALEDVPPLVFSEAMRATWTCSSASRPSPWTRTGPTGATIRTTATGSRSPSAS